MKGKLIKKHLFYEQIRQLLPGFAKRETVGQTMSSIALKRSILINQNYLFSYLCRSKNF